MLRTYQDSTGIRVGIVRSMSRITLHRTLKGAGLHHAWLRVGGVMLSCRIGRNGVTCAKREGDNCTPATTLRPIRGFYRADRRRRPPGMLPMAPLRPHDGWCDASGNGAYNRMVRLPFAGSHEEMWRNDHVYDIVLELDWNVRPRRQGRGSAIFLHLTNEKRGHTAGCIAIDAKRIEWLLARLSPRTRIVIL